MTGFIGSFVAIGWLIEELIISEGLSAPSIAIFDVTEGLGPGDYDALNRHLPPIFIFDTDHLNPQTINVIFADDAEPLKNLTGEFFKASSAYIFVTSADVSGTLGEFSGKFNVIRLFAINQTTGEISIYDPGLNRTRPLARHEHKFKFERMPKFDGNPLRVVYFPRDESFIVDQDRNITGGQDALVMMTIAERFNATLELVNTTDGRRYGQQGPNGTIQGAFTNVLQGTAELTGNTHFMKYYGTEGLQFTHYLSSDKLCLLVPEPKKIPNHVALYENVKYRWFCMYVMSCTFGLMTVWKVEKRLSPGTSGMSTATTISMVFRIFFAVPVLYPFNKLHERVVISSYLLATVVISNFFQGIMTTIASSPSYEKTMNTLDDVKERAVPILYSNQDVKSYLTNEDLKGLNFIEVSVEENMAAANRSDIGRTHRTYSVFAKKNMAYVGRKATMGLQIVPECLVDYPLAFVVPQGLPLLEPINRVLAILVESGLYLKWTKDSVPASSYIRKNNKRNSEPDPLKSKELYYAYALLALGLSVSSVIFVAEKIVHQKTSKTRIVKGKVKSKKHYRFVQ